MALVIVGVGTVITYMGINSSIKQLEARSFEQLKSVRDIKKAQIETLFDTSRKDIEVLAKSKNSEDLVNSLIYVHKILDVQADAKYPVANQLAIDTVSVYEEYFKNFVKEYNYQDAMLICRKHGHVMYTVAKESDFGENLVYGELKNSSLYKVWKKVVDTKKTHISDMEPYGPSGNKPSMFIATPIYFEGKFRSVLVLQIGAKKINDIMNIRVGMGETGESYLVGRDKLMRSDSYLDTQYHTIEGSFKNPSKGRVDTVASNEALSGQTDTKIIVDYNGYNVLSAYTPVKVFGDLSWALIVEINESEVIAQINEFKNSLIATSAVVIVILLIIAYIINGIIINKKITEPIKSIVDRLKSSSESISTSSNELTSSSHSLSETSSTQAASVEEISANIEESGSMIVQNYNNTKEADKLSVEMKEYSEHGRAKIDELLESMSELDNSSQKIANIVGTIDEIAFQTNLLALNAAVEAARAGEHGLGFAVVAEEVRALAGRSSAEAKAISTIIDDTISVAKNGQAIAHSTSDYFSDITIKIDRQSSLMSEISYSSEEQKSGSEQIVTSIHSVDRMTQNIASSAEEIASSAEELSQQADNSKDIVTKLAKMIGLNQ
jgi:methyl-accepting chemotaxis protein